MVKCETILTDGKVARNGKVYPSELFAKCNEEAPIQVRYRDMVVGDIQHIRNEADCAIASMSLDKGALEKLKEFPAALSFRGATEISGDGEHHISDVESANFVVDAK